MNPLPKAAVVTHGCRYNQFESAEISQHLQEEGFEVVAESQKADLYIINTCTVTGRSDHKSRQSIRKLSALNREAAIVVTGCYSQMSPEEIGERTDVDLVIGNREKYVLADYLRKSGLWEGNLIRKRGGPARIYVDELKRDRTFHSRPVTQIPGRTKAYLKIQSGCDQTCSFCIVTLARGDSSSDLPENVIRQFKGLLEIGFREIALTGIHLGSYGRDLTPPTSLATLLERLVHLEGAFRIRLSSVGPAEMDQDLIRLMKEHPKICPSLHLPLQSGDDEILSRMRRNYTSSEYKRVFNSVCSQIPGVGIGADVMAGFPGESEESFQKTLRLVEELPFAYLHVFQYSERPGTDAAGFSPKVPASIGKERAETLKALALKKMEIFRKGHLGTEREILVEKARERGTGLLKGHTDNFIPVLMEGEDERKYKIEKVLLTRMEGTEVHGRFSS